MEIGQATKLTVYVDDSTGHGRGPLYRAVVRVLHGEGIAGAHPYPAIGARGIFRITKAVGPGGIILPGRAGQQSSSRSRYPPPACTGCSSTSPTAARSVRRRSP